MIANFRPAAWASMTRQNSTVMSMTPAAESSTYCPFCHSYQMVIEITSVPGL